MRICPPDVTITFMHRTPPNVGVAQFPALGLVIVKVVSIDPGDSFPVPLKVSVFCGEVITALRVPSVPKRFWIFLAAIP